MEIYSEEPGETWASSRTEMAFRAYCFRVGGVFRRNTAPHPSKAQNNAVRPFPFRSISDIHSPVPHLRHLTGLA